MPATTTTYDASCGSVKHVNLMIDTFIANAPATDLRAVIRSLLVTFPSTSVPFHHVARSRLKQSTAKTTLPSSSSLFAIRNGSFVPTQSFTDALSRARMLFGAGLGVDSLPILICVIRATFPLRWTTSDNDILLSHLAVLDSDLSQAIQSCKEEVANGFIKTEDEYDTLRIYIDDLYRALEDSRRVVATWGGEFCFDRGYFAVEYWRRTLEF
ncbi:hypothetical protein Clacol_008228 [Clathrus columnatus]|uniref:Uncharacterized protein n=1 Tax=Clathrus columnatus TaxID=1419009 RepID=A0AAV5ANI1_9AGAM|nr:hypothetical protein Clacol_008228 [Clathrus columnatus]